MNIEINKKGNKISIKAALRERQKIEKVKEFTTKNARSAIIEKFGLEFIKNAKLISRPPHDLANNTINLQGEWVFELEEKKPLDNQKESVRIEPQIEAETPLVEESEPEASLFSEPLPYGLKSTAKKTTAKKKRTTKKKKIEE